MRRRFIASIVILPVSHGGIGMGFFKKLGQHMELMSRMFGHTGITRPDSQVLFLENDIRQAMSRCASCQDTDDCAKWLDEAKEGSSPPEFCRNAAYIEQLRKSA